MQKTVLSSEYLSSYGSLKILGQLLGGGTLVGGGGGDVKLVPIVPTADPQPPSCPPHHYISSIFIHPPPPSPSHSTTILYKTHCHQTPDTQPYFIECVLEPDKHRAKGGVLGLAGCALLIGVLIEGITNTYWVQIPSATLPTICPEP